MQLHYLIENMYQVYLLVKLYDIESDFDGTVAEILVENGEMVEYGQPLFRIA